jgi:hypothetical protein
MRVGVLVRPTSGLLGRGGYTRANANETNEPIEEAQSRALPTVLTIAETWQLLRISRWLLYEKYIHTGKLRTIKIGHRRVVPLESIEKLLREQLDGGIS